MKKRNSNIELMRIICIIVVIIHHCIVHGFLSQEINLSILNQRILYLMAGGGRMAINCFLLITGYFGVKSLVDTKNKVFMLWKDRWVYSLAISIIMLLFGISQLSLEYVLRAVFPTILCRHNYITTFIFLELLIPFINKGICSLSQKEYQKLLVIATIIMSVFPTFLNPSGLYKDNAYSYLLWMIYIYCIGGYMQLYNLELPWKWLSVISIIVIALMTIIVEPACDFLPVRYTTTTQYNII